jgi:predicted dehydrogenase
VGEACHFIDFMTFLVGSAPLTVSGSLVGNAGKYREDNAMLTLGFPDGSVGLLSYLANGSRSFSKERVEVLGGGKSAVLEDFRSLDLFWEGKQQTIRHRLRQDKGHRGEWEAFTKAILQAGPPPIPYEHVFGVSRAAILALEALRTGKTVRIDG